MKGQIFVKHAFVAERLNLLLKSNFFCLVPTKCRWCVLVNIENSIAWDKISWIFLPLFLNFYSEKALFGVSGEYKSNGTIPSSHIYWLNNFDNIYQSYSKLLL